MGVLHRMVLPLVVLLFPGMLAAQEAGAGAGAGAGTGTGTGTGAPYLIPQTIFVGDKGRMVVPLGPAFAEARAFVAEGPDQLPGSGDLVIRRLELERRGGVNRLLIDFVAYAPGRIPLPPLELPGAGGLRVDGLELSIASILSPSSMILAEPAPPLAVPGTAVLIYGTLALTALLVFLGVGGGLKGRRIFAHLRERLRRGWLLYSMERALKRFRLELGPMEAGELLARLSGALRNFISLFTGTDCRAWTAGEFCGLYPALAAIFRRSDTLRFSGTGIGEGEAAAILEEVRVFLAALREAERAPAPEQTAAGGAA